MRKKVFANHHHLDLCNVIYQEIKNNHNNCITFANCMDIVLYHPNYGYYATNQVNIGKKGDFFTSPHLGPDFGELLARQFTEIWQILDQPTTFQLVEMGAGQGVLGIDVLEYIKENEPNFYSCLQYLIIEKSPALKLVQQEKLSAFTDKVKWCEWEDLPDNSVVGCFFSNELVDAFPVHKFIINEGEIKEIYVTCEIDSNHNYLFQEVIGDISTEKIKDYFEFIGVDVCGYESGYQSEVNLAALEWIELLYQKLKKGYVMTIDYGYPSHRYYNPQRRQGTLQCYYQHTQHNQIYANIGYQDLTAHVDFTALAKQGELIGLKLSGMTQQGLFLMALGLGDRLSILSQPDTKFDLKTTLHRHDILHQLIAPMGLGGFTVLVQHKGLSLAQSQYVLKGLVSLI